MSTENMAALLAQDRGGQGRDGVLKSGCWRRGFQSIMCAVRRSRGALPRKHGPLAQLVEHWTFNPLVDGSSPSRPTISFLAPEKSCKSLSGKVGFPAIDPDAAAVIDREGSDEADEE